jgi:hypothetical protein
LWQSNYGHQAELTIFLSVLSTIRISLAMICQVK